MAIDEKKLIEAFAENDLYLPEVVKNLINNQPKIGGWIPCSERLPEKDGKYICTQENYDTQGRRLINKTVEVVEFYRGNGEGQSSIKLLRGNHFQRYMEETYESIRKIDKYCKE